MILLSTDEQVSKGLKLLRAGLFPFVEQEMEKRYGSDWHQLPEVVRLLQQQPRKKSSKPHLDTQALLNILWNYWNDVFTHTLHQEERNLVSELRMARNKLAHDNSFSIEDTYRVFDSIVRLLTAISACEVTEVEQMRQELIKQMLKQQLGEKTDNVELPTTNESNQLGTESVISTPSISLNETSEKLDNVNIHDLKLDIETAANEETYLLDTKSVVSNLQISTNETGDKSEKILDSSEEMEVIQGVVEEPESTFPFFTPQITGDSPASVPNERVTFVTKPLWKKGIGLLLVLATVAASVKITPYFLKPKLEANLLTIGTLGDPEYQANLADYLREQLVPADFGQFLLGKRIQVVVDGDKTLPYQEAERRIANKEWDIAFTLSPVISVAAKDSGYTHAAKMFPSSKNYQSALFVRANSPIRSIDDLKHTTTVALGGFNSASSFYMPSYDLYGKSLRVDVGHRGPEILEMVKTGRADVGAAAVGDTIRTEDPSIRIIHQSRDLPSSGVYLSPKLSNEDRQTVAKLLLSASPEIQKKANYGAGEEPNYSFFREIISKAQSIQVCSDFTKNPINLFCANNYKPVILVGQVNGWSRKSDADILNVRENSGKNYRIALSPELLAQVIGHSDPVAIQGKEIQVITGNIPQQLPDGSLELKLTQARQLKMLSTLAR